jgi:hypothetical protein
MPAIFGTCENAGTKAEQVKSNICFSALVSLTKVWFRLKT